MSLLRWNGGAASVAFAVAWIACVALTGCNARGSSGRRIVESGGAAALDVALAADGQGVVVYQRRLGTDAATAMELWMSEFTPDGGFLPAERVVADAVAPHAAIAADGTLQLGWLAPSSATSFLGGRVTTQVRRPGRDSFEPPVELDPAFVYPQHFKFAGSRAGDAIAVFAHAGGVFASASIGGGEFRAPEPLAEALDPQSPWSVAVAMNALAVASIVHVTGDGGGDSRLAVHRFDPVGGFVSLGSLATAPLLAAPATALADDGRVVVAWTEELLSEESETTLRACLGDIDGNWGPIETLAVAPPESFSPIEPAVGFDGSGAAFVAWSDGETELLRVVIAPAGGTFGAPLVTGLPSWGGATGFGFAVEPAGRATLLTERPGRDIDARPDLLACRCDALQGVTPEHVLSPARAGDDFSGIMDLDAVAEVTLGAWVVEGFVETFAWRAPLAGFAVDPALPVADVAAQVASISVPRTQASAIALVEWDLDGDGSFERSGQSLLHTFPAPGDYPITMRATDGWGDRATTMQAVAVSSGDGSGPPWLLTVSRDGSGAVHGDDEGDGLLEIDCPTDCSESYADGFYVFLSQHPEPGHHFVRWEGLEVGPGGDGDYGIEGCVVHMTRHRAVNAVFAAD